MSKINQTTSVIYGQSLAQSPLLLQDTPYPTTALPNSGCYVLCCPTYSVHTDSYHTFLRWPLLKWQYVVALPESQIWKTVLVLNALMKNRKTILPSICTNEYLQENNMAIELYKINHFFEWIILKESVEEQGKIDRWWL